MLYLEVSGDDCIGITRLLSHFTCVRVYVYNTIELVFFVFCVLEVSVRFVVNVRWTSSGVEVWSQFNLTAEVKSYERTENAYSLRSV